MTDREVAWVVRNPATGIVVSRWPTPEAAEADRRKRDDAWPFALTGRDDPLEVACEEPREHQDGPAFWPFVGV